jgi:hypothetical protein
MPITEGSSVIMPITEGISVVMALFSRPAIDDSIYYNTISDLPKGKKGIRARVIKQLKDNLNTNSKMRQPEVLQYNTQMV